MKVRVGCLTRRVRLRRGLRVHARGLRRVNLRLFAGKRVLYAALRLREMKPGAILRAESNT